MFTLFILFIVVPIGIHCLLGLVSFINGKSEFPFSEAVLQVALGISAIVYAVTTMVTL